MSFGSGSNCPQASQMCYVTATSLGFANAPLSLHVFRENWRSAVSCPEAPAMSPYLVKRTPPNYYYVVQMPVLKMFSQRNPVISRFWDEISIDDLMYFQKSDTTILLFFLSRNKQKSFFCLKEMVFVLYIWYYLVNQTEVFLNDWSFLDSFSLLSQPLEGGIVLGFG